MQRWLIEGVPHARKVVLSWPKRLFALHKVGAFFVMRAKTNLDARRLYSACTNRSVGIVYDQTIVLEGDQTRHTYPDRMRRVRLRDPATAKMLMFLTNNFDLPAATICALTRATGKLRCFQVDQAAPAHQALFRHIGERGKKL